MLGIELSIMVEEYVKSLFLFFLFLKFIFLEMVIFNLDKLGKIFDGIEVKFFGMFEELDDVKVLRDL